MSIAIADTLAADLHTVTRIEIADHVESAFVRGAAHRDKLVGAARDSSGRPALLAVLAALPDRQYTELRALWTDLPEVPISY